MKNMLKTFVMAISLLTVANFAKAQSKVGFVNFQALITQLPEAQTVKTQLDAYQKQFIDQLTTMNTELQTKGSALQAQGTKISDAERTAKQAELQDIQKRMQDYQNNAQQQVEAKSNELIKPLSDKVRAAVNDVAKAQGYAYVLDYSQGALMLVSPDAADLTAPVKAKLGLK